MKIVGGKKFDKEKNAKSNERQTNLQFQTQTNTTIKL